MKTLFMAFSLLFSSHFAVASERLETDIVDTAVVAGNFKTLVAAAGAAGLVDALKSPGPLTVFAPIDSAFAKLPEGSVEYLLENIPALSKLLTYHVVAGEVSVVNAPKGTLKTLEGQSLKISVLANDVYVNDAKVLDIIPVKNGQVVVIDTVLRPF